MAFNLPLERTFHYLLPSALHEIVQPGVRVLAPFGPRERMGVVLQRIDRSPIKELRPVRRAVDPVPVITDERWELAKWLARYYCCSLGEALAAMVPSALRIKTDAVQLATRTSDPAVFPLTLTRHQQRALAAILRAMTVPHDAPMLLHGITGSGKTELYLRAIDHALRRDRATICLIPEISLTPQTIDRFLERFGSEVAVWHSRLGAKQRAEEWARIAGGTCRVVVGARSAVFAPVQRLGLVIIDEEHETTYKQQDTPRYHARDVAMARSRLTGATVLLGSATPSVESYHAASQAAGRLVTLPERIQGRQLPRVELIDMREELAMRHRTAPLSDHLQRALQQTVERGEQTILLLNRRGFARISQCKTCGAVERCRRCSVPLVYHASRQALVCHYCNFDRAPEEICPECRKGYLRFHGTGTERVESELHRLFPTSSIARMDRDTTVQRESHRRIYEAVRARQVNLLVGTQMIAKGFDFPQVTLVGVVSADTALNLPDFRAGERTFDLLTQVAGRAGRGDQPGRVLIQTFCPEHYAIQAAKAHDYRRFYAEEIRMRRGLKLPPFVHLIELMLMGSSPTRVQGSAGQLGEALRRSIGRRRITVLGPAPHRIPRLRRNYRVCVILKAKTVETMLPVVHTVLGPGRKFRGMPVGVDVDPL